MIVTGGRRNIGVAVDFTACSKAALRWALASLARPGDRLVLVHVKGSFQYEHGVANLWEHQGSPIIPLAELSDPRVSRIYGVAPDAETIDILKRAAVQKGKQFFSLCMHGGRRRWRWWRRYTGASRRGS
ncbi:hypothetical protein GUJ93_ZPchr0010g8390 [Zizania palustris]|uniref:UspA domain-containing protein n=1 Tax=Zizania palustris TaxID=103762 RepID=A0A8J5WA28_ZIZPA|nr:hypothetical protein GUJ93_ZPchr0010g8390 [Zizania palustris]